MSVSSAFQIRDWCWTNTKVSAFTAAVSSILWWYAIARSWQASTRAWKYTWRRQARPGLCARFILDFAPPMSAMLPISACWYLCTIFICASWLILCIILFLALHLRLQYIATLSLQIYNSIEMLLPGILELWQLIGHFSETLQVPRVPTIAELIESVTNPAAGGSDIFNEAVVMSWLPLCCCLFGMCCRHWKLLCHCGKFCLDLRLHFTGLFHTMYKALLARTLSKLSWDCPMLNFVHHTPWALVKL